MRERLGALVSLALVLGLYVNMANAVDLNSNLKAYWPLDGSAVDRSGGGHDGNILGNPEWIDGRVDGALSFDGDGDSIDCGNFDPSADTGVLTIALWLRWLGPTPDPQTFFAKRSGWGTLDKVLWNLYPNEQTGEVGAALPGNVVRFNSVILNEEWQHLTFTIDGVNTTVYVNGEQKESKPQIRGEGFDAPVMIGSIHEADESFNGTIDEVLIYDRILEPDEIQQLADGVRPSAAPVESIDKLTVTWGAIKQQL